MLFKNDLHRSHRARFLDAAACASWFAAKFMSSRLTVSRALKCSLDAANRTECVRKGSCHRHVFPLSQTQLPIEGLLYFKNFVSSEEEKALVEYVDSKPFSQVQLRYLFWHMILCIYQVFRLGDAMCPKIVELYCVM
jgi:hypothetical protein